jgi:hypothetical protein
VGYNTRVDNGQIDLWSSRELKPGIMGELHTFPFNDDGIQAAFAWLERAKDRPAE